MRMRNENVTMTTTTMMTTTIADVQSIFFSDVSMTYYNFLTTATWIRILALLSAFLCVFLGAFTLFNVDMGN